MEYAKRKKWWIQSQIDPRWNYQGDGISTRYDTPKECLDKLKELKEELGDQPPDLIFGYS